MCRLCDVTKGTTSSPKLATKPPDGEFLSLGIPQRTSFSKKIIGGFLQITVNTGLNIVRYRHLQHFWSSTLHYCSLGWKYRSENVGINFKMTEILVKMRKLSEPKQSYQQTWELEEEAVSVTGFRPKNQLWKTISHNCGSGFPDKYQDFVDLS